MSYWNWALSFLIIHSPMKYWIPSTAASEMKIQLFLETVTVVNQYFHLFERQSRIDFRIEEMKNPQWLITCPYACASVLPERSRIEFPVGCVCCPSYENNFNFSPRKQICWIFSRAIGYQNSSSASIIWQAKMWRKKLVKFHYSRWNATYSIHDLSTLLTKITS